MRRAAVIGRFALLGLALALAGMVAGCGATPEEPLVLSAPWLAGERSVFEMRALDTGAVAGTLELGVAAEEDGQGQILTEVIEMPQGSEAWRIHVGPDLVPVRTEMDARDESGENVVATLTADYGDGKVVINVRASGKDQPPIEIKLPSPPYFDNEQFIITLRALPLTEGWKGKLNDIITRTAKKVQIQVAVTGRETVTAPAGTFDCWVVELVGFNQKAWIAVDPPNQLVQYQSALLNVLVEYVPGR